MKTIHIWIGKMRRFSGLNDREIYVLYNLFTEPVHPILHIVCSSWHKHYENKVYLDRKDERVLWELNRSIREGEMAVQTTSSQQIHHTVCPRSLVHSYIVCINNGKVFCSHTVYVL